MRATICAGVFALLPAVGIAAPLNGELEEAAVLGAGMMLCDTNNGVGSGGWNDLLMRGADRMVISQAAAREFVEARQREIITHLNKTGRLDEFCTNVRKGKL